MELVFAGDVELVFAGMNVGIFKQSNLNERGVLFLAEHDADGVICRFDSDVAVKVVQVHLHLTDVLMRNVWDPPWISHEELAHRGKIGSGKSVTELAGEVTDQFVEEFLSVSGTVCPLLFVFEDSTADLVIRIDLQQIDAASSALAGRLHQTTDAFIKRTGIPVCFLNGQLHIRLDCFTHGLLSITQFCESVSVE